MTTHRRPIAWERILAALILLIGLVSGGLYYKQTHDQAEFAECQAQVNEQFLHALQLRVAASEREEQAQRDLLTVTAGDDPAAFVRARARYLHTLDELKQARREHPLPSVQQCR